MEQVSETPLKFSGNVVMLEKGGQFQGQPHLLLYCPGSLIHLRATSKIGVQFCDVLTVGDIS